jgi:hypothetical protein
MFQNRSALCSMMSSSSAVAPKWDTRSWAPTKPHVKEIIWPSFRQQLKNLWLWQLRHIIHPSLKSVWLIL